MAEMPTVARFLISSTSSPKLTSALWLAERVHLALVRLSGGSEVFVGCDRSHRPLQGHGHAHIFCECNPGPERGHNGEVTHVTVYAPVGFAPGEQEALQNLRDVWGPDQDRISLALQGLGRPEDFAVCSPLLARSQTWASRTPFIPTRHPKVTRAGAVKLDARGLQIGGPEHELRRLLGLSGFPEPVAVEPVSDTILGGQQVPWQEFACRRANGDGRRAAYDRGYGFRIEFPQEVQGPLAVGYGAHFGLGGFEAQDLCKV